MSLPSQAIVLTYSDPGCGGHVISNGAALTVGIVLALRSLINWSLCLIASPANAARETINITENREPNPA